MEARDILKIIAEALEKHPDVGILGPTCYSPEKLSLNPSFAILEENEIGLFKRFNISVDDVTKNRDGIIIPL